MTARADSLMRLEQEVGVLIRRVRRVIGERALAVHPELQSASFLLLTHLAERGPLRASELAETFQIDKGAISRQVGHLMELGLVERQPDPEDGRASLLSATPEALRRLEEVVEHRRRWLAERLDEFAAEDLDEFVGLLARYNQALERQPAPAPALSAVPVSS